MSDYWKFVPDLNGSPYFTKPGRKIVATAFASRADYFDCENTRLRVKLAAERHRLSTVLDALVGEDLSPEAQEVVDSVMAGRDGSFMECESE